MTDNIIDYIVVESRNVDDLRVKVREKMRGGWVPLGGVAVSYGTENWTIFAQAMVRLFKGKIDP